MDEKQNYVDVTEEPMHHEIYKDEKFRIYAAEIPPGASTLFHRHSEDTLYVISRGGRIKNESHDGYNGYPVILPTSTCIFRKILLGLQSIFKGFVYFPEKFYFMMTNKNNPVIHRATTWKNNRENMILLGIEILHNSVEGQLSRYNKPGKREFDTANCPVFSISLKPDEAYTIDKSDSSYFIVCLTGQVSIENDGHDIKEEKNIKPGEYVISGRYCKITAHNIGVENAKLLTIVN